MKYVLIDPPSGWAYGFPVKIKSDYTEQDYINLLKEKGYPEKYIPLALQYSTIYSID